MDALSMLLMNISSGVRPYLVVFLATSLHWNPVQIGYVMGISGFIGILVQSPAGALVDKTRRKRALIAIASFIVAASSVATVLFPTFWLVTLAQSLASGADTLFFPSLIALSLGLVGKKGLEKRLGRNQTFIAIGNGLVAILIAVLSHWYGVKWIYYLIAALAICAMGVVFAIRESDIDHSQACGDPSPLEGDTKDIPSLFNATTIIFVISLILYTAASGSLLPMLGQLMSKDSPRHACTFLSACLIISQIVMIPLGIWVGKLAEHSLRRPLFLVALVAIPIRAILYTLNHDPYYLASLQVLDAISTTFAGILSVLIVSDLANGTGKFNFMQGIMATAGGLGAALSSFASGYLIRYLGYDRSFLVFAALGLFALLFFYFAMPETKKSSEFGEDPDCETQVKLSHSPLSRENFQKLAQKIRTIFG
jgi:MFS family permease